MSDELTNEPAEEVTPNGEPNVPEGGEQPAAPEVVPFQDGKTLYSFKRSQIAAMSPAEYQAHRADIMSAMQGGRIINDIKG